MTSSNRCPESIVVTVNLRVVGSIECDAEAGHFGNHWATVDWADGERLEIPEAHAPAELTDVEVPVTADDDIAPLMLDEVEASDPIVSSLSRRWDFRS